MPDGRCVCGKGDWCIPGSCPGAWEKQYKPAPKKETEMSAPKVENFSDKYEKLIASMGELIIELTNELNTKDKQRNQLENWNKELLDKLKDSEERINDLEDYILEVTTALEFYAGEKK